VVVADDKRLTVNNKIQKRKKDYNYKKNSISIFIWTVTTFFRDLEKMLRKCTIGAHTKKCSGYEKFYGGATTT